MCLALCIILHLLSLLPFSCSLLHCYDTASYIWFLCGIPSSFSLHPYPYTEGKGFLPQSGFRLHLPFFVGSSHSILPILRACSVLLSLLFKCLEHLLFLFFLIHTALTLNFSLKICLLSISFQESSPTFQPILVPLVDIPYLLCLAFVSASWCFIFEDLPLS